MSDLYSVSEVAKQLGVSVRLIQHLAKKEGLERTKIGYQIPSEIIPKWLHRNKQTQEETKETQNIIEEFTPKRYAQLETIIKEYPELKEASIENRLLKQEVKYKEETIEHLQENIKLANRRFELLMNTVSSSLGIISEKNHLQFIDITKPKE